MTGRKVYSLGLTLCVVAGSVVDLQFVYATPNRTVDSQIAEPYTVKPHTDFRSGGNVF